MSQTKNAFVAETDHWSCACSAGFVSTGDPFPTCVDQNGCQPNHCGDRGDPGAACIDLPAPATGYNCPCTSGFAFNGTTCASSSSSCDDQLASCQASLAMSQTSLASCQTDLAASAASLAASQASAAGCQAGLVGCQADLTASAASLAASQSSLATCQTGLASCQTDLAMSAQSLNACTSNLESCNAARDGQVAALASCQSTKASLHAGLGACQTDLTACQTIGLDIDRDGIPDRLDRCPATPAGTAVDPTGCSLAQFCALVDASTPLGIALCLVVDWQNDEPIAPALDCKVSVSQGQKSCVPNL